LGGYRGRIIVVVYNFSDSLDYTYNIIMKLNLGNIELDALIKEWTNGECLSFEELYSRTIISKDPIKSWYVGYAFWYGYGDSLERDQKKAFDYWFRAIDNGLTEGYCKNMFEIIKDWTNECYIGGKWNDMGCKEICKKFFNKFENLSNEFYTNYFILNCIYSFNEKEENILLSVAAHITEKIESRYYFRKTDKPDLENIWPFSVFLDFYRYEDIKFNLIYKIFNQIKKNLDSLDKDEYEFAEKDLEYIIASFESTKNNISIQPDSVNVKATSIHEASHFVIQYVMSKQQNFFREIIISNYGECPGKCVKKAWNNYSNKMTISKEEFLEKEICTCLAGNIAETEILKKTGMGSTSDLRSATNLVRDYTVLYGFGNFSQYLFDFDHGDDEDFFHKLSLLPTNISQKILTDIDELLTNSKKNTIELVNKYSGLIIKLADFILLPEHKYSFGYWVLGDEVEEFVKNELKNPLPNKKQIKSK